jgi:hypothetical protein
VNLVRYLAMNRHIENLLSQIKRSLAHLKQSNRDDLHPTNEDLGLVKELKRLVLQLVQVNTNSLSQDTRENIRSALVEAALFVLQPEQIEIIQESERRRAKLYEERACASTRSVRREPTMKLRRCDEQQILFLRDALKDSPKKHGNFMPKRKHYVRTLRALGIKRTPPNAGKSFETLHARAMRVLARKRLQ